MPDAPPSQSASQDAPLIPRLSGELTAALAGRYRVVRTIGSGGMAVVYLATDLRHGREVALKVMRREFAGAVTAQRFLREIAIAAKLAHPNIVPLHDSGQADEELFYVMPFVSGLSLGKRLLDGPPIPFDEVLRIAGDIGDALAYAHAQGIVHRDIKPDNVLLESGRALVTDFGIARAVAGDTLTTTHVVVGTPKYMSPEQRSGDTVDARSDQYSFALVVKEMLGSDAPAQARAVLTRALDPDPALRFASVTEFVTALKASADAPAGPRRPVLVAALLGLGVIAAAALIVWVSTRGERGPAAGAPPGRIVVAPLENRTRDSSLAFVGVMAGDWMTEGLEKSGILEVVPTVSAVQATQFARDPSSLASETGAGIVVGGAYYQRGDSLLFRVTVADQGGKRVAETLTDVVAPSADPIKGIEELRNRLMGWLALRYDERIQRAGDGERPPTYDAYRAFSEGLTRYIAVDNAGALPLFLRAATADSTFTEATLYASIALSNMGQYARADTLLQRADRRRRLMSDYHRAWLDYRTAFVRGNREAALAAIRVAAREAPGSKSTYNLAVEAFQTGHLREALDAAKSLSPEHGSMRGFAPYWTLLTGILHARGDYAAEVEAGNAAVREYPDGLWQYSAPTRALAARGDVDSLDRVLARAAGLRVDRIGLDFGHLLVEAAEELHAHGKEEAARATYARTIRWLRANPGAVTDWRLARALYASGSYAEARTIVTRLRARDARNVDYLGLDALLDARGNDAARARARSDSLERLRRPYDFGLASLYRAKIAAVLGDRDGAMARLRDAFAQGLSYHLWLHRDADFDSVRAYAPFAALVRGRE